MTKQNPEKNWFGTEEVTPEQKTRKVIGVFDSVANKYDIMNDVMSGGLHRLWKDHLVRKIRPRPGLHYLDVAGGTGDIAFRIKKALDRSPPYPPAGGGEARSAGGETRLTLCDLNTEMLRVGRDRAIDKGYINDFDWVTGNAEALPVPDNSVDVYTIAFGLRNVTHIDTALSEAYRVLKPGGRFYCLEFSQVGAPLSQIYDAYSYRLIPKMGEIIAKDRESYQYLVESIRKFPSRRELIARMETAGFRRSRAESLTFGVVAIHEGFKT
jgi:demethylmenaquinone methyltransferase / 2-methoxy-6-polyprenyl-1,4-benzoquinol methylase